MWDNLTSAAPDRSFDRLFGGSGDLRLECGRSRHRHRLCGPAGQDPGAGRSLLRRDCHRRGRAWAFADAALSVSLRVGQASVGDLGRGGGGENNRPGSVGAAAALDRGRRRDSGPGVLVVAGGERLTGGSANCRPAVALQSSVFRPEPRRPDGRDSDVHNDAGDVRLSARPALGNPGRFVDVRTGFRGRHSDQGARRLVCIVGFGFVLRDFEGASELAKAGASCGHLRGSCGSVASLSAMAAHALVLGRICGYGTGHEQRRQAAPVDRGIAGWVLLEGACGRWTLRYWSARWLRWSPWPASDRES